jgi:hypothetical protein
MNYSHIITKYLKNLPWLYKQVKSLKDSPVFTAQLLATEKIDLLQQVYDAKLEDNAKLLNMKYEGDWVINLPSLSEVDDSYRLDIRHYSENSTDKGRIVAVDGQFVDGENQVTVFGGGFIEIAKIGSTWTVIGKALFKILEREGETKQLNFVNTSIINIEHNMGRVPIVQVWVLNSGGIYILSNTFIEHDWVTNNSFTVTFEEPVTCQVLYN